MSGGKELVKKIILFEIVVIIYLVLTSTIITYRTSDKVSSMIIDSAVNWSTKSFRTYNEVINREKRLEKEIDINLTERLSGAVLLQVESKGEAWYVYPKDKKKYFLGSQEDIYKVLKEFGREASNDDLVNYRYFNKEFPKDLLGFIVWDSDIKGEAYYVKPEDKAGYYFDNPEQALKVMTEQGTGITNENLRKIETGQLD